MNKRQILSAVAAITAGVSLLTAIGVQASMMGPRGFEGEGKMGMGVVGTVTAVSGNTITVTSKMHEREKGIDNDNDGVTEDKEQGQDGSTPAPTTPTTTTFTVDATNATIFKNGATSNVAGIAVGDTIMVQGTVTGTNVVAKVIRDGMPPKMQPNALPQGNGQPIVGGTITVVSGNTVTITNKGNITYTIDVTNAKIQKPGVSTATVSDLKVGDNIIAQGLVNGTSVTASSVIDQNKVTGSIKGQNNGQGESHGNKFGFMMGIGNFFRHLFGF